MTAALLLWRLLSFTLSDSLSDSLSCATLGLPPRDSLLYVSVECSHDSLAWAEVARWGARHWTGGAYTIAVWPDTLGPGLWYRVSPVRWSAGAERRACPSRPLRIK